MINQSWNIQFNIITRHDQTKTSNSLWRLFILFSAIISNDNRSKVYNGNNTLIICNAWYYISERNQSILLISFWYKLGVINWNRNIQNSWRRQFQTWKSCHIILSWLLYFLCSYCATQFYPVFRVSLFSNSMVIVLYVKFYI